MAGAHEKPGKWRKKKNFDIRHDGQRQAPPPRGSFSPESGPAPSGQATGAEWDALLQELPTHPPRTLYDSTFAPQDRKPARRRRKGPRIAAAVLALTLIAAVGLGAYKVFSGAALGRNGPSAAAPQGAVKAMLVSQETLLPAAHGGSAASSGTTGLAVAGDAAGQNGAENQAVGASEMLAHARQQAARAAAFGLNALLVPVADAGGAVCRVEGWPVNSRLKGNVLQEILAPVDTLSAYCKAAGEQGLSVYAVVEDHHAAAVESLSLLWQHYPLAGVYARQTGESGASYAPVQAVWSGPVLPVQATASTQAAGEFFVAAVQAQAAGTPLAGLVFEGAALEDAESVGLMASALEDVAQPTLLGYTPDGNLTVTYPTDGVSTYSDAIYMMGTSAPGQSVTLNGQAVEAVAPGGSWAVLAQLPQIGSNALTITQGGASVTVHVQRLAVAEPGAVAGTGEEPQLPHDDTVELPAGSFIQLDGLLTSLLYDPAADNNISETARRGTVARVVACQELERGGHLTWAYQLASGDWVLAEKATVLDSAAPAANFTGAQAAPFAAVDPSAQKAVAAGGAQPDGRTEVLTFQGSGTPLAYTNQDAGQNTLSLKFYDTQISPDFTVQDSQLVQSVTVTPFDGGCELILHFSRPLWGHLISFENGTVRLTLKSAPSRSQNQAAPLAGVSVLLDAGHGGDDPGAVGVGGTQAPMEKDLNLAAAMAAKMRLEQLGASVHMIRADDTFLTLDERNEAISLLAPDFFVAVHHNSMDMSVDSSTAAGVECYYFYDSGQALAGRLVEEVSAAAKRPARGSLWGYYYVTRNTLCPAVLLETGFVVNPTEYEQASSEAVLWATGDAIARAILSCVQP